MSPLNLYSYFNISLLDSFCHHTVLDSVSPMLFLAALCITLLDIILCYSWLLTWIPCQSLMLEEFLYNHNLHTTLGNTMHYLFQLALFPLPYICIFVLFSHILEERQYDHSAHYPWQVCYRLSCERFRWSDTCFGRTKFKPMHWQSICINNNYSLPDHENDCKWNGIFKHLYQHKLMLE